VVCRTEERHHRCGDPGRDADVDDDHGTAHHHCTSGLDHGTGVPACAHDAGARPGPGPGADDDHGTPDDHHDRAADDDHDLRQRRLRLLTSGQSISCV
jgi:hypothetical protein